MNTYQQSPRKWKSIKNSNMRRKKKTFFTEVEKRRENIIKEIMAKNSPNWATTIYISKKLNIFHAGKH